VTSSSESEEMSPKAEPKGLDPSAPTVEINLYGDIESETAKSLPACKAAPVNLFTRRAA